MAGSTNKRRIDRVRLYAQISASLEQQRITVIDVSEIGARIEHGFPLSTGSTTRIAFEYHDVRVEIECEVVRCKLDRSLLGGTPSYTSGLRFVSPDDPSVGILLDMLRNVVREDLPARRKIVTKKKAPVEKVAKASRKK